MNPVLNDASTRAAQVARDSYGRLLSILAARTGDINAAEDALADAFRRALETWPEKGIPEKPEAWLITVSKRLILDQQRSAAHRSNISLDVETIEEAIPEESMTEDIEGNNIPDERLKLLFVCAHPAIDRKIHTPLMLQTVLGFEATDIGRAFLVPASTMAQRLVRAKRKIRDAGIPFTLPAAADLAERLGSVLEAIYGVYAIEWSATLAENHDELAGEALFLADLLVKLLPDEAEALGLLALLSYSIARQDSHHDETGCLIPLDQQDTALWDHRLIDQADKILRTAQNLKHIGRFQLEAAIQAVHCARKEGRETDWMALAQLYEGLYRIAPTVGAAVGRAAVFGRAYNPETGLSCLDQIEDKAISSFQPAWATRAYLLQLTGAYEKALEAYDRTISLTTHIGTRHFLEKSREQLRSNHV